MSGLGCDRCRALVYGSGLPRIGLSRVGRVAVDRCPFCRTHWIETERVAYPVTDEEAARVAPDVVQGP